jgi:hypothetical protein
MGQGHYSRNVWVFGHPGRPAAALPFAPWEERWEHPWLLMVAILGMHDIEQGLARLTALFAA